VAGSSASSRSSPNAPPPSTTRADRMPPVAARRHHRSCLLSRWPRLRRGARLACWPTLRTSGDTHKTPFHQPAAGLRDPVGLGERHDRTSVTPSVTPRRRLRFPPLP
jgi:hypothetical protein